MEVAIIGLPLSGKTTIFNALTGSDANTARSSSGRCQVHTATVQVPDPRVAVLSGMFNPRKITYAQIQFNDVSGLAKGGAEAKGLDPQLLHTVSQSDALLPVVRAFEDPGVSHPDGDVDALRDLQALRFELAISDLGVTERRMERIQVGLKKARADRRAALEHEFSLMERFQETLEGGGLVVDLDLPEGDRSLVRGYQFLTAKPTMVVVNVDENADTDGDMTWADGHRNSSALTLKGVLEMEIAQLPDEDRSLFMETYGIAEPSLNVMLRECYNLLGLMSFFTVGEDEVRAWTVRRGATAVEAAGAIHSDLARGFIRAEAISYNEMIACGSLAEARRQGKLRLEGKEYAVQDGDILNIRFNV